jgi:predicted RNase H-like nuclease (RuvC/YqgF family)
MKQAESKNSTKGTPDKVCPEKDTITGLKKMINQLQAKLENQEKGGSQTSIDRANDYEQISLVIDPKTGKLLNSDFHRTYQDIFSDKKKTVELITQLTIKLRESERSIGDLESKYAASERLKSDLQGKCFELETCVKTLEENLGYMKVHYDSQANEKDEVLMGKVQDMEDQ